MSCKSICSVCGVAAKLQCSRCKKTSYCGVDHQKTDWKNHKTMCKGLYEVRTDEVRGRHLVASCDIAANTEIFNEHPIVFGPKFFGSVDEELNLKCIGCFKAISGQPSYCNRCQWPVCSDACPALEIAKMHGLECSVLALGTRIHISEAMNNQKFFRPEAILPLKCLLMKIKQPQKFTELMAMESHLDQIRGTEMHKEFESQIISYLNANFLDHLKKYDDQTEKKIFADLETKETLLKICGIIETNAICIRLENDDELNALYKIGSLLEHSCVPNCFFSFDVQNGYKLKVRAGRDIAKGEHISIMYTNCLWGTQQRQEHLRLTKCFTCTCARCKDPTEFGTHFSSLKCLGADQMCDGYNLPENPTNSLTDWTCSNDDCQVRLSNHQVFELMQNVGNTVEHLLVNESATIKQIEDILQKLSSFLHPHHYYMFALKHRLVQLYGFQPGFEYSQLKLEEIDEKIALCMSLTSIIKALDPHYIRLSVYAGTLALELYKTLAELKRRKIDRHQYVGFVSEHMEELLVFGKFTLHKDLDVPEAKQLYDRFNQL